MDRFEINVKTLQKSRLRICCHPAQSERVSFSTRVGYDVLRLVTDYDPCNP